MGAGAVWQARAKDLRLELLNSERLAAHFEAHPGDLALLRHDKPLAKAAGGSHLKGLPGYLARAAGKATPSSLAPGTSPVSSPPPHACSLSLPRMNLQDGRRAG